MCSPKPPSGIAPSRCQASRSRWAPRPAFARPPPATSQNHSALSLARSIASGPRGPDWRMRQRHISQARARGAERANAADSIAAGDQAAVAAGGARGDRHSSGRQCSGMPWSSRRACHRRPRPARASSSHPADHRHLGAIGVEHHQIGAGLADAQRLDREQAAVGRGQRSAKAGEASAALVLPAGSHQQRRADIFLEALWPVQEQRAAPILGCRPHRPAGCR